MGVGFWRKTWHTSFQQVEAKHSDEAEAKAIATVKQDFPLELIEIDGVVSEEISNAS